LALLGVVSGDCNASITLSVSIFGVSESLANVPASLCVTGVCPYSGKNFRANLGLGDRDEIDINGCNVASGKLELQVLLASCCLASCCLVSCCLPDKSKL
jgi:hypothetical protein